MKDFNDQLKKGILTMTVMIAFIEYCSSFQISRQCPGGLYFDKNLLECTSCPSDKQIKADGSGCECSIKKYFVLPTNSTQATCVDCPTEHVASFDRSRCMPCPTNETTTDGECLCPSGSALIEKDSDGNYLNEKQCLNCPNSTFPINGVGCRSCPGEKILDTNTNQCVCNTTSFTVAGEICVPNSAIQNIISNYPVNSATIMSYSNEETADPLIDGTISIQNSDTIFHLYLKAAYECQAQLNFNSCQILANLCVLQMYDRNSVICKFYEYLNNLQPPVNEAPDPNRRQNLPWLYYLNTADKVLNNTNAFQFEVSFDTRDTINVNQLQFYLAKYDILGNYYGMSLLSSELQLCSKTYEDGVLFRSFGTTIVNECNVDLTDYVSRDYVMYFYELYLLDPTNNKLVDIPVMIDNIPNPKASGVINNMNNGTLSVDWILTRRFFLVDNLGAVQGAKSFVNGVDAIAIRFPKLIKLIVTLQQTSDSSAKIMVPYLEIFYKTKRTSFIQTNPGTYLRFVSEYSMSIKSFMDSATGIFVTINIIVGIMVSIRMYVWYRLNPPMLSPDNYSLWFIWTCIFKLFKYWGTFIFWFTWGVSAYWYIFFKLQYRVFVLLPPLDSWIENYRPFDLIFGLGCSAYTFYICYLVAQQTNFDIFFIDWEHDKEILIKNASEVRTQKYRGAWRVLHVANQFNELQKKRDISLSFGFCWIVLLWGYAKWSDSVTSVPSTIVSKKSPENYVLMHFLASLILICAGFGQYIVKRLLRLWIPLKKQEFIDLCCVSNISVFILDQSLHGYYIHGQSPAGKADTNLDELLRFLEDEGTGKVRSRGLSEKDSVDLQCYEMYISYTMRTIYDGLYLLQTESMMIAAQNRDKLANQSRIVGFLRHLPKNLQTDKIYHMNTYMNFQLKNKIENVSSQSNIFIRDKTKLQRFLDYPPPINLTGPNSNEMILYKDSNMNFDECLITGIEWQWFVWDVYVFQMWMLTLNDLWISIFCTWVCDQILYKARVFFGEKNIARKAVIDNKFFS